VRINLPERLNMDPLSTAAASGIRSRMESLELLANNIANQATAGYKTDREFHNLFRSPYAEGSGNEPPTSLPTIESQWTDFSQGAIDTTGNPLDLAISGDGFFLVEGSKGTLFTRSGQFEVSPDGTIETQQGFPLLDTAGQPILVDPSLAVEVTGGAALMQEGQLVAQIGLTKFTDPQKLRKEAGVYFSNPDAVMSGSEATDAKVHQGAVESANFSPAEATVRMVGVMRQFEMLQKALQLGSDMNRHALQDVAKVSP
jgi:flagellar basal-body rod protein FlgF